MSGIVATARQVSRGHHRGSDTGGRYNPSFSVPFFFTLLSSFLSWLLIEFVLLFYLVASAANGNFEIGFALEQVR